MEPRLRWCRAMLCGVGPSRFSLPAPSFNTMPAPALPAPPAQAPCSGGEDLFTRGPTAPPGQPNNSPELAQLIQILRALLQGAPQQAQQAQQLQPGLQSRDLGSINPGGAGWANAFPVQGTGQTAPTNPLAARALDWSAQQMNPATATAINPSTGLSGAQSPDAWTNYCLKFVSSAYGDQIPELNQNTAYESYKQFAGQGRIREDRNPPAGAPVFFNQTQNTPFGHVGIATGKRDANGEPLIRTTGVPGFPGIHEVPLSVVEKYSAGYLGWAKI